jgi:xanthine dehydrogenase YagR molybdenum-binding subunit
MGDEKAAKVRLPHGIAGVDLGEIERALPAGEPPPLAANAALAVIGKPAARIDGRAKVTGAARYTADVKLPGMLFARLVRSPHPHARVTSIDTSAAEAHPQVRAVHVIEKIFGSARLRDPSKEPPSKYPIARYVGQPVAAVAATSPAAAEEAARLVKVEWEPLPFVVDLEAARAPDAPLVFPGAADQAGTAGGGGGPQGVPQTGNVHGPVEKGFLGPPKGDVAKGLAEADVTVAATFRTQVQTHSALETHGVVADWREDGLTVYASTQGTFSVRDELAEIFGIAKSKIRVVTEFMGGGFGAKFGAGNYGVAAVHLSKKAGAPVRLVLDRHEEHLGVGNRPSSVQTIEIGAKKDGALTAIRLRAYGTAGTGTGAGSGGPAQNMYPAPSLLTEESDVFTHAGPAAAFRAPGHPQGCFALEQAIDELAEKLGMDPLALRDKIDVPHEEGKMLASAARREERRLGAERIGWKGRHAPGADAGPVKRGIGVAQAVWFRIANLDSACEVRVARDGSVELRSGVQDIGGGIRTALAQVVAEELGLRPADVVVKIGDTAFPIGPASGGSMTTGSITPAARGAAWQVKRQLAEAIAPAYGCAAEEIDFKDGELVPRGTRSGELFTFKGACAQLPQEEISARASRSADYEAGRGRIAVEALGGVQFAAVAVDVETGVVKVERVVAVHDCGRPVNPLAIESQVNGGVLQGISYALYENRQLDRASGRVLNANLEQYKIAGARETPAIEVILLEQYHARSSTDAAGIGEPATIPTAAAIANAVYNATGARVRELPMTPARVLEALAKKEKGELR